MKTKKCEDFIKRAQGLTGKVKFAAVGKGSTWQLFEGSDLVAAEAKDGKSMIKASCQYKQKAFKVVVVGGSTETNIFKQRIFADPLKANPNLMTFKAVSAADDAALEQIIGQLEGTLV